MLKLLSKYDRQIKFLICGGIGAMVQIFIFHLCYGLSHLNLFLSYALAFIISATTNYALNSYFTFKDRQNNLLIYFKYIITVLITFLAGEVLMYTFIDIFNIYYVISNMAVILMIYPLNYVIGTYLIWDKVKIENRKIENTR